MFTVNILKTENVSSILKFQIKEKNLKARLDQVSALDLALRKVFIPLGDDVNESLEKANIERVEPLNAFPLLSQAFPSVEANHLHVVIEVQTDSELVLHVLSPSFISTI
jgi:hypothetical protein